MRKLPREKARPFVFIFSGVVFIILSLILSIQAVVKSNSATAIVLLFVGGLIFICSGYYTFRRIRKGETIEK